MAIFKAIAPILNANTAVFFGNIVKVLPTYSVFD